MKKRQVLLLAVVLGVGAVALVYSYLTSLEEKYEKGAEPADVLVARYYIEEGTLLKRDLVQVMKMPARFVQPNALKTPKDLVNTKGQNIYSTAVPIAAGEQVLTTKLTGLGKEGGLTFILPGGTRAISMPVDSATGVAGLIRPGNRVDILGTFDYTSTKGQEPVNISQTVTVLQNVLIVACGREIMGSQKKKAKKSEGGLFGGGGGTSGPTTITLALTPLEAEILTFSAEKGSLRVTLRPAGDSDLFSIPGVSFGSIISRKKMSLPGGARDIDSVISRKKMSLPVGVKAPDIDEVIRMLEKAKTVQDQYPYR